MAYAGATGHALSFENTIPSKFSGWHYDTWTSADLRQVARAINLIVRDGVQKRDLYQLIVEHRPESSQLSLAEANAIQAIKHARSLSKASTSRNESKVPSIHTTVASKKRRSSARYRVTPRKRRMHDFVSISSDSEYVDSDDDNSSSIAFNSSPGTDSYGESIHGGISPFSSLLTRLDEFAILGDGAELPRHSLRAALHGSTNIEACGVCSEAVPHRNRLPRNPTSHCTHDRTFICFSCLQQHITASTSTHGWESIRCPHVSCNAVLSFVDMQLFAPPEVFTRYDEYINRKGLEALTDYIPCANLHCSSGGFVDLASDSFATCSLCDTLTCVVCKTRYHPGLTHGENMAALTKATQEIGRAQERLEEETASQTFMDKRTKTCPNQECGVRIQKASGCNHMTCAYCGHEFCWLCLAGYNAIRKYGNAHHAKTCKLHSTRLK